MTNEGDRSIVQFCSALADACKLFRTAHIRVEKKSYLKDVVTTVSHARGYFNEALLKGQVKSDAKGVSGVEISYSIDGELNEPVDNDKYSIGASIVMYSLGDHWLVQGDVGWSCLSCGWDDERSFEWEVENAQAVIDGLPRFCGEILSAYIALVDAHGQE